MLPPTWFTALLFALAAVLLLAGMVCGMQWLLARIYHEPLRGHEPLRAEDAGKRQTGPR